MANKSLFVRRYRKIMGAALEPEGFHRMGSHYWRERNRLLHLVLLDRATGGNFTVEIAIQPLFLPSEFFTWSLGGRPDDFCPGAHDWWELPEAEEMDAILQDFAGMVVTHGLSWLNRFQSSRDVVEAYQHNWGIRTAELGQVHKKWQIVLCALDAEMYEVARRWMKKDVHPFYRDFQPFAPWHEVQKQQVSDIWQLLQTNDQEGIRAKLAEWEAYTRDKLGIGAPPGDT